MQIVNITQVSQVPVPSTAGTLTTGNLDPKAAVIAGPPGPASYSSKSSIVAYNNIGQAVDARRLHVPHGDGRRL